MHRCHCPSSGSAVAEAELQRWVTEPVMHTRESRQAFPVKLYVTHHLDPALAQHLTGDQRAVMRRLRPSLTGHLAKVVETTEEAAYTRQVLDLRRRHTRATQT